MSFSTLVAPPVRGGKRSKKDVAQAILQIPRDDHSNNLMLVAESLAKHEVLNKHSIIQVLARHLAVVGQLRNVRLLSKQIADSFLAEGGFRGLYRRLYVSPMYTNPQAIRSRTGFNHVAHWCTEIVVKLKECYGNHRYAPGVIFRTDVETMDSAGIEISDWTYVFKHCLNLKTLTVVTASCPTGILWNRTSSALTALRTAFEESDLPNVTTLRMKPADMVYIGQFKWNGPAFGRASAAAESVWSRITHLELQLLPLVDLEENQRIQTFKMFSAWLQALAPRLRSLKLCYLSEREGQHPFALFSGLNIKHCGQGDMRMPELRELWLGRVKEVEDSRYILEPLAPKLLSYRVLVRSQSPDIPIAFDLSNPREQWRTIYIRATQMQEEVLAYPSTPAPEHIVFDFRNRSASFQQRPSMQTDPSSRDSTVPPSPSTTSGQGRSSTTKSRTPSSSFRALVGRTSNDAGHDPGPGRSSLPSLPKPLRRRASSAVSSIFKIKPRPKSEPNKPVIKFIGETPLSQVPKEFLAQGAHFTTLSESIARYGDDSITDLSQPPVLRKADEQQVGMFKYTPGTLFQAGTGTKIPDVATQSLEGSHEEGARVNLPKSEQIQKAFEKLIVKSIDGGSQNTQRADSQSRTISHQQASPEQSPSHTHPRGLIGANLPRNNHGRHVRQGSSSSWQTIEQGNDHFSNQNRSAYMDESERGSGSRRQLRRMSELEDVEEEDNNHRPGFGFRGLFQ